MLDDRAEIVRRLREDIFGPRQGAFERIPERPSNRYLTGILFPQGSQIDPSEDDKLDSSQGSVSDDEPVEDHVALFQSFRPSTCGISFAVGAVDNKFSLRVGVVYAKYQKEGIQAGVDVSPSEGVNERANSSSNDRDRETYETAPQIDERTEVELTKSADAKKQQSQEWVRYPYRQTLTISPQPGETHGSERFGDFECVWRVRGDANYSLFTLQFLNLAKENDLTGTEREESTLFQFRATIVPSRSCVFLPRPSQWRGADEDEIISELIYREVNDYAVGHTASASWKGSSDSPNSVRIDWLPMSTVKNMDFKGDEVFAERLASANCSLEALRIANSSDEEVLKTANAVVEAYSDWIEQQRNRIEKIKEPHLQERGSKNLDLCVLAVNRMRGSIDFLRADPAAMDAFRMANRAMYIQAAWSKGKSEALSHDPTTTEKIDFRWRPFQFGYALMCLESTLSPNHEHREVFDLIWFPTGGGKTEAYLLLVACVLFDRRMRYGSHGGGVAAFMRYTLRTLTIQQFQRAAALILACEMMRREVDQLGAEPYSIGLWVGSGSTPNGFDEAKKALKNTYVESTPKQQKKCPICRSELTWRADEATKRIVCECKTEGCAGELPIYTVDTDIYDVRPSLIIGTVDKFAQVVRSPFAGRILSADSSIRGPDLIIQDELHLISGPLGSLTGLYEAAIDHLCENSGFSPKIIGSTATIRRAESQIKKVFFREAFQFPPPAVDWSNSCFAKLDKNDPGRLYIGATTAGRSEKFALQAIAASLLQSGFLYPGGDMEPYNTLVAYFNSLKTLGGAMVLMEDDVRVSLSGLERSRPNEPLRNSLRTPEELTSRKASSEIEPILSRLNQTSSDDGFIDILLASNMLSVGVDIPRLGLMLVTGQPKTMSEYIQATSRVGRSQPGIVVTLYNNAKIRDRAHYESFQVWHGSLYRSVEPGSVTPFAPRARDKALHAPLVALARHRYGIAVENADENALTNIANFLLRRIEDIDEDELTDAQEELGVFIDDWVALAAAGQLKDYWNDRRYRTSLLMSAEKAAARRAAGQERLLAIPTPNSLRNVEPGATFILKETSKKFANYQGAVDTENTEKPSGR